MPCDHQAVTAVVALAAADQHRAVNAERDDQFRRASAGVLHEDFAGDAVVFDRAAIEFAHLGSGQSEHVTLISGTGLRGGVSWPLSLCAARGVSLAQTFSLRRLG